MKRKNIFLSFYAFLLYSLVIFIAVTVVLMSALHLYLEEYEAYQPTTFSDEVLLSFQNLDAASLERLPVKGDSLNGEVLEAYLNEVINPDTLFNYKSSTSDTGITYDYISNNKKIATLSLEKTGALSPRGFEEYKISSIEWHPLYKYTITAPEGTVIKINGSAPRVEPEKVMLCDVYEDFDGSIFYNDVYTIDYLEYVTDITAEEAYSAKLEMSFTSTDEFTHEYAYKHVVSEETVNEVTARATDGAKAYIYYTTKAGVSVNTVLPYVHKNAALYNHLRNFNNTWNHYYAQDEYKKFEITDFRFHSDDKVSCRLSAVYGITKYYGQKYDFDFDFDLYLIKENGVWYITSMERVIKADE